LRTAVIKVSKTITLPVRYLIKRSKKKPLMIAGKAYNTGFIAANTGFIAAACF
jgi:ethanolamine transporter EutH